MRISFLFKVFLSFVFAAIISPGLLHAQSYDSEDRPVLQEEFCVLLKKIMNDKPHNYANLADTALQEYGASTMDGIIPVREDVKFAQARRSMLIGNGINTKYRTIFMVKDSKEGLLASYNNVFSIIKDCLFFDYEFKETAYFGVKGIADLGYRTYENIGKPQQITGEPQAIIYLLIEKNRRSGQYELVLEMR